MNKNRYIPIIASLMLSINVCYASDINDLVKKVIANNRTITVTELSNKSEIEGLRSENNLQDPEIGLEHQWGMHNIGNKWSVSISQSFDWPSVYSARKDAIRQSEEAMSRMYLQVALDKMLEIKLTMLDIINAKQNIILAERIMEYYNQLRETVKKGVDMGEMTRLDLNKLDIECARISSKLVALNRSLNESVTSLEALNGGHDCNDIISSLVSYPDDVIKSEDYYVTAIETYDPTISYNRSKIESSLSMAKAARRSRMPGFSVGYGYEYELGERFNILSLGITLPLFSHRHKSKAAEYEALATENENESLLIDGVAQMKADRNNALLLIKEIDCYRPSFEREDNMALLKKAYDGGQINLITFIQEMDYFLSARQEFQDMIYRYNIVMAKLNRYSLLD